MIRPAVPDHLGDPVQSASPWNPANALTVVRLLLVPVFVAFLVQADHGVEGARTWAAWVFALAAMTDFVDGDLARRHGWVTSFGKVADPLADKALTGSALVGLSWLGLLPWWVTAVVLIREVGVTLLRFWVIEHGVIPASRGGKLKTVLQIAAIFFYLLPLGSAWDPLRATLMTAAVVVTMVTGLDYVRRARRLRAAARELGGAVGP